MNWIKMKQYKFLFTDLDGTLINTLSGETFPKDATAFQLREEGLDKIKSMPGLLGIFIVTNQGGIPEYVSEQDFKAKLHAVVMFVAGYCDHPTFCRYCASTDKSDPMRKPNTGMLEDMMAEVLRPKPSVIAEIPVESINLFKLLFPVRHSQRTQPTSSCARKDSTKSSQCLACSVSSSLPIKAAFPNMSLSKTSKLSFTPLSCSLPVTAITRHSAVIVHLPTNLTQCVNQIPACWKT